jgi:hypothetical protein
MWYGRQFFFVVVVLSGVVRDHAISSLVGYALSDAKECSEAGLLPTPLRNNSLFKKE